MHSSNPPEGRAATWKWHGIFLIVIAFELGGGWLLHRDEADLRRVLDKGSAVEKVEALHVLANRGEPGSFEDLLPEAKDGLVREFAMTTNITRLTGTDHQWSYVESAADPGEAFRSRFFLTHAVGTGEPRIRLRELEAYFATLDKRP